MWSRAPFRIAGGYAVFAGIYIVASDWLLLQFAPDAGTMATVQSLKGVTFILLSALVIHVSIDRELRRREKVEDKLAERERTLRAAADYYPGAFAVLDRDRCFRYANERIARLGGREVEEILGRRPAEVLPRDVVASTGPALDRAMATGRSASVEFDCEIEGSRRVLEVTFVPIGDGPDGTFLGIGHDRTEQRRFEDELRQSAGRLQKIADTIPFPILITDREKGGVVFANLPCREAAGVAHDSDTADIEVADFFLDPADHHRIEEAIERDGRVAGMEVRMKRANGSPMWVHVHTESIEFAGRQGCLAALVDITEKKSIEDALRRAGKMEAIGQLTGGVAHDFNNLLQIILGNAEQLLDSPVARDDDRELLNEICESADRGAELAHRLLAFARQQPLDPSSIGVNRLIKDLASLIRRTLPANIEVRTILDDETGRIVADPGQLENALLNLAINARDAMPDGGQLVLESHDVEVEDETVRLDPELLPGRYVRIRMTDTGCGMSRELLDRVLEPFFTTKDSGRGTGLGLSMVYGFVKQSGGHLRLYSEVGRGTTVSLYLPREETGEEERPSATAAAIELPQGEETILVVEDDPLVRSYVATQLESLGYTVVEAEDGHTALRFIEGPSRIDLMFSDLIMPGGLNGVELAEKSRELRADLRIVFTTGYAEHTVLDSLRAVSNHRLLTKPYRKSKLATTIREALDD